jgi:hemin uptake protein HemP
MKEEQLREDQRREALARKEESHAEDTLPPPTPAPRVEEPALRAEAEPASRVEAQPALRAEEPAPQPKIDSKALLESDGLVMIETDRSKAPAAAVEEAPQQLGRPRRERPRSEPQDEELQQVETRK